MNLFLFEEKLMFHSPDIYLLWNPQISKSATPSSMVLNNGSYSFACFFGILGTIKMKFGQIPVYFIINISEMFFGQCWRL